MAASEFCISMSALVKSILRLLFVLDPLKQISADLNKAKEVLSLGLSVSPASLSLLS